MVTRCSFRAELFGTMSKQPNLRPEHVLLDFSLCKKRPLLSLPLHLKTFAACQSIISILKPNMSALNTTNTSSLQAEEITDEIRIFTYCNVGLSVLTMFTNTVNFFFIRKRFVTSFVNRILQIDSLVTAACQIGYIGILLSSISDPPNAYICNVASFFVAISMAHFFLTNLLIVLGR